MFHTAAHKACGVDGLAARHSCTLQTIVLMCFLKTNVEHALLRACGSDVDAVESVSSQLPLGWRGLVVPLCFRMRHVLRCACFTVMSIPPEGLSSVWWTGPQTNTRCFSLLVSWSLTCDLFLLLGRKEQHSQFGSRLRDVYPTFNCQATRFEAACHITAHRGRAFNTSFSQSVRCRHLCL